MEWNGLELFMSEDETAGNADRRHFSILGMMLNNDAEAPVKKEEPKKEEPKEEIPTATTYSEDDVKKMMDVKEKTLRDEFQKEMEIAEEEKPKKESEWAKFQKLGINMPDVLESDYEHKAWLLTSKFLDKQNIQLHDLALKELAIANLPDTELALIYSFKMDCIEDWLSLGYSDLSKQRLLHMLFRLRLSVSVDAKELTLQHGQSNVSMTLPMGEQAYTGLSDEEEGGGNRPKLNIKKFLRKLGNAAG